MAFPSSVFGDPKTIYVNYAATGANDGTSWPDSYLDLQDALENANFGDQIWIAGGRYTPDRGTKDRTMSFNVPDGVELYGGFAGWEKDPSQRDCISNETILSGDLNGDDQVPNYTSNCFTSHNFPGCDDPACQAFVCAHDSGCCGHLQDDAWMSGCPEYAALDCIELAQSNVGENSHTLIRAVGAPNGILIDGLTIRDAFTTLSDPYSEYMTIYLYQASAIFRNVVIQANSYGLQAIHSPSLEFDDCAFLSNILYPGYAYDSSVTIRNCTFVNNGRGFGTAEGPVTIADSTFGPVLYDFGLLSVADGTLIVTGSYFHNTLKNWSVGHGSYYANTFAYFADDVFEGNNLVMTLDTPRVTISNCKFLSTSDQAIEAYYTSLVIRDSLFDGVGGFENNFGGHGTIEANEGSVLVDHCTFATCYGLQGSSGSVMALSSANGTIRNSVLWDQHSWGGTGLSGEAAAFSKNPFTTSTLVIENCVVEGWTGLLGGTGNTGADPMFVDPPGPDGVSGTQDDDLRVLPSSPAINAGDPNFTPVSGETDLDGHARVLCGRTDIGAYEFGIGDYDCNQIVNVTDFANWMMCASGPQDGGQSPPYASACAAFDFDADGDVDLKDLYRFQDVFEMP